MTSVKEPFLAMYVGGNELSVNTLRKIVSLSVTYREKKATDGTITFSDPDFILADSNVFRKGRRLAFLLGWLNESRICGPFIVKAYDLTAGADGSPTLVIRFQDMSHKMNKKQKKKKHTGNPAQIIKQIANIHNLGYDIESIETLSYTDDFPLIQSNMTDARLLQVLADRYGYVWGLDGMTLYFRRPQNLDEVDVQKDVPVLSYRINGATLLSFTANVKYISKGKRKGAKQKNENVDLLSSLADGEIGNQLLESARDTVGEYLPQLGSLLGKKDTDQEDGDDEATGEKRSTRVDFDGLTDIFSSVEGKIKDLWGEDDEDNEEDASDSTNEDEARRKLGGKLANSTEVIEATLVPRIASAYYQPGQSVIAAGIGERFSGKYRISEVTLSYGNDGFATSLKVKKREFKSTSSDRSKIANKQETSDNVPGNADSSTGQPSKDQMQLTQDFDPIGDTFVLKRTRIKKIDGVSDA